MMDKFEVPNLLRRDLLMLCYRGDDKADEALSIIRAQLKPNLSREEERELVGHVRKLHLTFIQRRIGKNKRGGVSSFIKNDANWLALPVRLPIHFKFDKLPPPLPPEEDEDESDSLNFRKPSNYCFLCSSTTELGAYPLHLTRRLSKSLVTALQLQSTEKMDYERNLLGCVVCPPCYEKVIEVNDAVKELELIQWNLKRMAGQLDELLSDGIQNHTIVQVEIHGVPPTYLTPIELRKEIVESRKKERALRKVNTKSKVPINTTTRCSALIRNNPQLEQDSFSPKIISVDSLAPSNVDSGYTTEIRWEDLGNADATGTITVCPNSSNLRKVVGQGQRRRKTVPTYRQIPFEEPRFLSLDHSYSKIGISTYEKERDPLAIDVDEVGSQFDLPNYAAPSPGIPPQSQAKRVQTALVGGSPLPLLPSNQHDRGKKSKQVGKQLQLNQKKQKKVRPVGIIHHLELRCAVADCSFSCSEADRLQGHVNGVHHKDPRPFKCNYAGCPKMYSCYINLRNHHKRSHGFLGKRDLPFKCDQCSRSYLNSSHLRSHQLETHSNLAFPCPTCAKVFKTRKRLRNHMRIHLRPKLKCPSVTGCSASFNTLRSLESHQRTAHPTEFPHCRTQVQRKSRERVEVSSTVELICEECGKMVNSVRMMKRHMRKKHHERFGSEEKSRKKNTIRLRKCPHPDCGFKTTDTLEMKRHKLSHGVVTPTIPCSMCSKMFTTKQQMKTHERLVHIENSGKEFTCGRCGKEGFRSQAGLDAHDELCQKGGLKDIICESCNMKFLLLRHLMRHKTHQPNCKPKEAGPRSVYCGTCGELCCSNNSLARHTQLIHNQGSKPFQCSSCPKSFPIKMYLTRHLKESKYCPGSRGYDPPAVQAPTLPLSAATTQITAQSSFTSIHTPHVLLSSQDHPN